MKFYGIDYVAHELHVHPSSLLRWEENGLITPERATMGRATLRVYDEKTMRVPRRAKALMDGSMTVRDAFGLARAEMGKQEEQHCDRYGSHSQIGQ